METPWLSFILPCRANSDHSFLPSFDNTSIVIPHWASLAPIRGKGSQGLQAFFLRPRSFLGRPEGLVASFFVECRHPPVKQSSHSSQTSKPPSRSNTLWLKNHDLYRRPCCGLATALFDIFLFSFLFFALPCFSSFFLHLALSQYHDRP